MDIKYCQHLLWLTWDLIHIPFHFPENADIYIQVFCAELGVGVIVSACEYNM